MTGLLRKAALALLVVILAYLVLSAIVGFIIRAVVILAVGALILYLLWGGPDRD